MNNADDRLCIFSSILRRQSNHSVHHLNNKSQLFLIEIRLMWLSMWFYDNV